jgi:biopolymer transport protein TolQ
MTQDMSIAGLIGQASLLVQIVMVILLLASIASWVVIVAKRGMLKRAAADADRFENNFWSGGNLADLHEAVRKDKTSAGITDLFREGYDAFARTRQQDNATADDVMSSVNRSLRVTHAREIGRLETGLAFLATVGSVSPYIGLFGTVWGIMNAFIAIGQVQQATVAMVAPGIAEALIATAIGLFAAIPAVIAYNMYSNRIAQLDARFRSFADEMAGILERSLRGAGREA